MRLDGHPTPEQLDRYAGRTLAPAELLAVDDHLAECAACRDALAARWDPAPAVAAWRGIATAGEPGEEARSPLRPWLLAASLLLAAGLSFFLFREAELRSRLRSAQDAVARLEPEVGRLREENRELQREVERLAERPAEPVGPAGAEPVPGLDGAVAQALEQGRLPIPRTLAEVRTSGSVLRSGGGAEGFAVRAPVGTAVRSDRPLFRWAPLEGAAGYRVVVFDRRYQKVLESGEVDVAEWTPPQPLPRGQVLIWQVVARRSGGDGGEVTAPAPPAPEARFRILPRSELSALENEEAGISGSRLARAVLLARAGLLAEAETELRALARESPGSPVVERLLASLEESGPAPSPTRTNPAQ